MHALQICVDRSQTFHLRRKVCCGFWIVLHLLDHIEDQAVTVLGGRYKASNHLRMPLEDLEVGLGRMGRQRTEHLNKRGGIGCS